MPARTTKNPTCHLYVMCHDLEKASPENDTMITIWRMHIKPETNGGYSEEYIPFAEEIYHDFPGWKNSMNAFVQQMSGLNLAGRYYLPKFTGDAQYNSNVPELDLFHTRACEIKEIADWMWCPEAYKHDLFEEQRFSV